MGRYVQQEVISRNVRFSFFDILCNIYTIYIKIKSGSKRDPIRKQIIKTFRTTYFLCFYIIYVLIITIILFFIIVTYTVEEFIG